jgi:DNA-binding NtrC family response regulator
LGRILELNPQAHVIVTSGFSRDFARQRLSMGAWSFLQKPFDGEQLVDAVRQVIHKGATRRRTRN